MKSNCSFAMEHFNSSSLSWTLKVYSFGFTHPRAGWNMDSGTAINEPVVSSCSFPMDAEAFES